MQKEALWGNLVLSDDRTNTFFGCLICHFVSFFPNIIPNPAQADMFVDISQLGVKLKHVVKDSNIDNIEACSLFKHCCRCLSITCICTLIYRYMHIDFWNCKFLTVGAVKKAEVCHRAKFHKNRLNCGQDIVIFIFFKMAAAAILDFKNLKFLTL